MGVGHLRRQLRGLDVACNGLGGARAAEVGELTGGFLGPEPQGAYGPEIVTKRILAVGGA